MIGQFSTIASIAPVRRECHYLPQQETIAVLAQLVERVIRNSSLLSSNHDKVWGSIPQVGSLVHPFFCIYFIFPKNIKINLLKKVQDGIKLHNCPVLYPRFRFSTPQIPTITFIKPIDQNFFNSFLTFFVHFVFFLFLFFANSKPKLFLPIKPQ